MSCNLMNTRSKEGANMLNPDPIVRAGVFAAPECMIPGRVQLKRSVQLVLQELTKNWSDDENVDLLFSITALADRLGANRASIHSGLRTLFAEDALRFRRRETDKRPVYYVDWSKIINDLGTERLGVQAHGGPHSFESEGYPKEPCGPKPRLGWGRPSTNHTKGE